MSGHNNNSEEDFEQLQEKLQDRLRLEGWRAARDLLITQVAEMENPPAAARSPKSPSHADHPDHAKWVAKMRRAQHKKWAGMTEREKKLHLAKMAAGRKKK